MKLLQWLNWTSNSHATEDQSLDERKMAVMILEMFAIVMALAAVLAGLAIVIQGIFPNPDDPMSENAIEIIMAFMGAMTALLAGAVGAALYPDPNNPLPQGVSRALVILGGGVAAFFTLLVIGTLLSAVTIPGGLSDDHTKVMLVVGTGVINILAFAGGQRARSAMDKAQTPEPEVVYVPEPEPEPEPITDNNVQVLNEENTNE